MQKQKFTILLKLGLALSLLLGSICHVTLAAEKTILVIGDSLSSAYNMKQNQGWVYLLEQKLKSDGFDYQVVNASISGETSGNALKRMDKILDQSTPQIVIVELGGNDGLRGFPPKLIKKNLLGIVDKAQKKGAKVLLTGIRLPPNYGKSYSDKFFKNYQAIADQKNTLLVPFILDKVGINPNLMQSDGIHPKAEAQALILQNIWPYLECLLR